MTKTKRVRVIVPVLAGLVFVLFGSSIIWWGVSRQLGQVATLGWVETQGTMIECGAARVRSESVLAQLRYSYTVQGRIRQGESLWLGDNAVPKDAWPTLQEELKPGAAVAVFYDPLAPSRAVLRRGLASGASPLWTALAGLPFVGFGMTFGVLGWRASRR